MRTWLATAAFLTRRVAMKFSAVTALLTVGAADGFGSTCRRSRWRRSFAEVA